MNLALRSLRFALPALALGTAGCSLSMPSVGAVVAHGAAGVSSREPERDADADTADLTNAIVRNDSEPATALAPAGAWHVSLEPDQGVQLHAAGESVVATFPGGAVSFLASSATPSAVFPPEPGEPGATVWTAAPGIAIRANARTGRFSAFDAATGAPLWDVAVLPPHEQLEIRAAGRAGDVLVVHALHGPISSSRFVAFDANDGRILWQTGGRSDAFSDGVLPIVAGAVLSIEPPEGAHAAGSLRALDLRTGVERWRYTPRGRGAARVIAWDADTVHVAVGLGQLDRLDPHTGRARGSTPLAGLNSIPSGILQGETLYLVTESVDASGEGQRELRALDATTGVERWRAGVGRTSVATEGIAPVLVGGDVVFCAGDGTMRTLDAATGAERARHGVGRCEVRAMAVAGTGRGATLFAIEHEGSVVRYAPGTEAPLAMDVFGIVRLDGEPLRRALVRVGESWTYSDDAGKFRVPVEARGWVTVQASVENAVFDPQYVDGPGRREIKLEGYSLESGD